jgi:CRP-like cAMP-binding protein
MTELQVLEQTFRSMTGMDEEAFALSVPYWQLKHYKKGEFYNEYKNVCKHLGLVISGIFRTYYVNEATGEEKNMLFYTDNQIVTALKSFLNQQPCDYYTECMQDSTILYIHVDDLHKLYEQSHQWERFGRFVAEFALNMLMDTVEGALFKSPEARYVELLAKHPDIFNTIPLYHIASYLGIQGPSLSRIRKRMQEKG